MRRVSLLVALPVLLIVLAGGVWVFIQQSGRPWRSGEKELPGLDSKVIVQFDARGVPHLQAETGADLFRGLGYIHANDRLTQMELGRRAAAGRLAELVGEPALDFDIYFRTLRFPETAEALWHAASAESKEILEAYAAGVNAYLEARSDLPPGLRLLGAEPEPWRPQDSLAFSLLMARDLSFWNGRPEEERFLWLRAFGAEGVRDLLGDPDLHVPEEILALAAETMPRAEARHQDSTADRGLSEATLFDDGALRGSNNWVLGASRSAGAKPLLANDPHLPLFLPSVWYQAHLRSPDYQAAGMTLPGTPGVVLGRGPAVAWAFTNVMLDDHDLFFEHLDEAGERYKRGDQWLEIEKETVEIRLRGGDSRQVEIRRTDIGPLLDAEPSRGLPARSLAWTAYSPGDPIAAILAVARAQTPEELVEGTRSYISPAQNLVAAFPGGELVHTMLGKTPLRSGDPHRVPASDDLAGDDGNPQESSPTVLPESPPKADGRLPSPGWEPAYLWAGLRAHEDHPRSLRPAEDLIVTANNDALPADYDLPFSADFFGPSRAERIRQNLLALDLWTREPFAAVQMDITSLHAGQVIDALGEQAQRQNFELSAEAQKALRTLIDWDRRLDVRGASALWVLVERELLERIWGDETRAAGLGQPLGDRDRLLRYLRGEMSGRWVDDISTEAFETWPEILNAALEAAWSTATQRWGSELREWRYGELHALELPHRLDAVPFFGRWSRRGPFPVPGSATTVLAFGAKWQEDQLEIYYGPSMRYIVDWSDPEKSWAVLPGGQSGHPADPHYSDQIAPYLAGELHEAPWSDSAIKAAAVSTLHLVP